MVRVLTALTNESGRQQFPYFILVPQCPRKQGWVDFPHFSQSLRTSAEPIRPAQLTLALVGELID
ncbi:hypothetical protein CLV58_113114 [Spirosoma oryzae]|uniref:Uncharacterized protein n=1 Tax=Spirosoma oryzae TaxID=1469603 RepID=A0A2T0SRI4_9BACT|nr:hypothetical protein [Spirosoma oryzae]PRY35983.1 hypothetical protein CLV58_113114 [Spirosoma oryzae]